MPPDNPLAALPISQVVGVEVGRLQGGHRQCDRAETPAGVVDGVNGHVAPTAADDAGETLLIRIGRGKEERHRHLASRRRCGAAREVGQVAGWAFQQAHEI